MCGISAVASKTGVKTSIVERMNNAIKHRGPDDEGYIAFSTEANSQEVFYGNCTPNEAKERFGLSTIEKAREQEYNLILGHRRLSIQDVSILGHQPMLCQTQRYSIVYNGELYNGEEIREALIGVGYEFSSKTDTEVILYGYIEWGEGILRKLNGMFSLIIFDNKGKELFIARDRFGIKPLYYWFPEPSTIAIASEIKQFMAFEEWRPKLNHARAYDFLNWGQTDHCEETLFEGVKHVPPSTFAKVKIKELSGRLNLEKWYEIPRKKFNGSFEEAVQKFEKLLYDSIKIRLKADVPVGTCLSGGLDSSSIVCVVNNILSKSQTQKTFSSCSEHKKYDEREYVHAVLEETKSIEPILFELDHGKFLEQLSRIIYHHDEPFLSPSVFAEWCVFEQVSSNKVKVTLDGHGADEQLMGYHTFFGPYLYELFRKFKWMTLFQEMRSLESLHGYGIKYSLPKIIRGFLPDRFNQFLFRVTNRPTSDSAWIDNQVLKVDQKDRTGISSYDSVEEVSFEQITKFSLPKQLRWCDRDSMAFSVESRVPYIDYRVVEFLASLPTPYKFRKGVTKRVLRKAMSKYLPEKVENRIDKMGFVTPAEIWVKEDKSKYTAMVSTAIKKSKGILNSHAEERMLKMIDGQIKFDHSFWRCLFFAEWMHVYQIEV